LKSASIVHDLIIAVSAGIAVDLAHTSKRVELRAEIVAPAMSNLMGPLVRFGVKDPGNPALLGVSKMAKYNWQL